MISLCIIVIAILYYWALSDIHWQNATTQEQIAFHKGFNTGVVLCIMMYLAYIIVLIIQQM